MLKRLMMTTVAAATLAAAVAGSAKADMREIGHYGLWHVNAGTTRDENKPMCSMGTHYFRSDAERKTGMWSKAVYVKVVQGGPGVVIQLFKDTWRIPENASIRVEVAFDGEHFTSATTTGWTLEGGKFSAVPFHIKGSDDSLSFLENFAHANKMQVTFPGATEPEWNIDLTGSRDAVNAFFGCVKQVPSATQPYSTPQATQPGRIPQPTGDRGA